MAMIIFGYLRCGLFHGCDSGNWLLSKVAGKSALAAVESILAR